VEISGFDMICNHCCDANMYYDEERSTTIAARDIKVGEELTVNYNCHNWDETSNLLTFDCSKFCKTPLCCKYLKGFKYLLPERQKELAEQGGCSEYVLEKWKKAKKRAKKATTSKSVPTKTYDYSGLEKGMKCQAESDGKFYAAEIVAVSTAQKRTKAPVKITYTGYEGYDEWLGGDRLKSKALKATVEKPEPREKKPREKPVLYYFPFAGRAELTKLIAAAGGLELEVGELPEDRKELCSAHGAPGTGLPLLQHGTMRISQSQAVQNYVALIAPRFRSVPSKARGIDMMWGASHEDLLQDAAKAGVFGALLGGDAAALKKDELKAALEKWFGVFEKLSPEKGFVTGGRNPSPADCVAVLLFSGVAFPWGQMIPLCDFDKDKYPKLKGVAERAASAKGLKEYLESSDSIKGDAPAYFKSLSTSK